MQGAHGVQQRSERIADVVSQVAGHPRLLHEEDSSRRKGFVDAPQDRSGRNHVVNREEDEHHIQRIVHGQAGDVAYREVGIRQTFGGRFGPGPCDSVLGEVIAGECRAGKLTRQQYDGVTGAARDVSDPRAASQRFSQTRCARKPGIDQLLVKGAAS